MVIQYNKRDLADILPVEELNRALNPLGAPFCEAVATTGDGVLKTFTVISKLVLHDMQKNPERHNFTFGDILGRGEKRPCPAAEVPHEAAPAEPSLAGASLAEARPEMAALEEAVHAGMKVNLGKALVEDGNIIVPFDVVTGDREEQFQLRVAIDMDAPLSKRFKIQVKNFKK
jgi:hypothetical protein